MKFPKPTKRIRARKPLRRKRYMRKRTTRRVERETEAERAYRIWGHEHERCGAEGVRFLVIDGDEMKFRGHVCEGQIQQAHLRDMTGTGRKESGLQTAFLCRKLHEDHEQAKGCFAGWSKAARKHWMRARIAESHKRFEVAHGRPPDAFA